MSAGRVLVSLVVLSSALVLSASASAATRGSATPTSAATRGSAASARAAAVSERRLADAKFALKGEAQRNARMHFNGRISALASGGFWKGADNRKAFDAVSSFTGGNGSSFEVQSSKGTVHSGLDTQAALVAKSLVQAVGPAEAKSYTASVVKATKSYVAEKNAHYTVRDIGHAYRFQRAVNNVVALGVTQK